MTNVMPELKDNLKPGSLDEYLKKRGRRHKYYRMYNKLPRLAGNYILNKKLYLTDGSDWNDVIDSQNFSDASNDIKYYGACFSFSTTESVAMWMLYGGLYDEGAMYNFTNNYMKSIVDYCDVIKLGNFNSNGFVESHSLQKGDYSIYLKDVLYHTKNENENSSVILHGTTAINGVNNDLLSDAAPVLKEMPWSYENEVRLIIEIKRTEKISGCKIIQIDLKGIEIKYKEDKKRNLSGANNKLYCSPKLLPSNSNPVYLKAGNKIKKIERSKLTNLINWQLTKQKNLSPSIKKDITNNRVVITII